VINLKIVLFCGKLSGNQVPIYCDEKVPKLPKIDVFCRFLKRTERSGTWISGILAHFSLPQADSTFTAGVAEPKLRKIAELF
jgi:hypothetical protein